MLRRSLCLGLLFLLTIQTNATAAGKLLRGASFEMDPYISKEVENGYFRTLCEAVFAEMGYDLSFDFFPYLRAPKMAETETYDFVAPAFSQTTKTRDDTFFYSDPLLNSDFGIVTLDSKKALRSKQNRQDRSDLVASYLGPQLSTDTIVQQIDMLRAGRVDQIYLERYLAAEVLVNKRPALIQTFQFETDPKNQLNLRIAIRKSHPNGKKLIQEFNATLRAFRKNGTYEKLLEKQGYRPQKSEKGQLNVASISSGGTELLKEMTPEFVKKQQNRNLKFNWTIANHGKLRTRILRSLAFKSSDFDVISLLSYDAPIFASHAWIDSFDKLHENWKPTDIIKDQRLKYTYKDEFVALPFMSEVSATFYRKDLFDAKNLKMPANPSFTEIKELASKLHDPQKKQYGFCMQGKLNSGDNISFFYAMAISNGALWLNENWKPMLDSKAWVEALETYLTLVKHYGPPDAANLDAKDNRRLFAEGHCAIWIDMTSSLMTLRDPEKSKVIQKFDLVSSPYMKDKESSSWFWHWSLAVPTTSKNKELAKQFVEWASSEAYAQTVGMNKGWQFVPPGVRKSIDSNPEYIRAEPYAKFIVNTIKDYKMPKGLTPSNNRENFLLFFEIWPAIGNSLSRYLQAALEEKLSAKDALELSQQSALRIMYQSGFYSPASAVP